MTIFRLAARSLIHYRRTHAAVVAGVAGAVAVLAGSLLVGASVRESLRAIAVERLGAADVVVAAPQPFTEALAERVAAASHATVAPMIALTGTAVHEASGRRAGQINVYGVDARFFALHGVTVEAPARSDAWLSPDLATELGAAAGDALVLRIAKPTDIPLDSLHGRRDEVGRSTRLSVRGALSREHMGDFSLGAGQGPARAVFVPLARLQRDLALEDRVNTLIVATGAGADAGGGAGAAAVRSALPSALRLSDFGLSVSVSADAGALIVESKSGLIPDAIAERVTGVATREGFGTTPVLTWLANRLTVGDLTVPYSLVSAVGADAAGDADLARLLVSTPGARPIVLNEWAARELHATSGSMVTLEYFRWADEGRLVTARAEFQVAGIVPMRGLAVDRRLAPDYPGITTATEFTDWDPPFPIDLGLVRPQDEAYWDQYRTAPKAFIALDDGQAIWRTRHGSVTSIRLMPRAATSGAPSTVTPESIATITDAIARAISPDAAGFSAVDVRTRNVAASAGATDFGAYFSYFSFFLMVAALLLSALFFRLSVEQRLPQIGVLRATGFRLADVRRLLMLEGGIVVAIGAAVGAALAVGWAALMMIALRTWWVDAVGTRLLRLHVDPIALVAGAVGAAVAALLAIAWTVRSMSRTGPRAQLAGPGSEPLVAGPAPRRWLAPAMLVAAALLSVLSLAGLMPAAGGFFGAGALVLAGGLAWFASRLSRSDRLARGAALQTVSALGLRNAAWRPGRSLVVAGLVAAAVFLLVSVDSFRKTAAPSSAREAGTGGFALMAESALPIVHDLNGPEGREAAGFAPAAPGDPLSAATIFGFRLRPGDDASCLNLYQPKQPRILGVPDAFVREGRFWFAKTLAADDASRGNPWTLLGPADADGAIPAIADATSLQYVLHKAVGDVIAIDEESSRPLRLRIVGSLDDSVLQGEIMIAESAFRQVFPEIAGHRVFLIDLADASMSTVDAVSRELEEGLDGFGFDAQETARRLEAFHRVENTYLSTFQALGGLGLVLGCLSLVAVVLRNVLERRRELALLGAAGFTGRDLQRLVAIEHGSLILVGLLVGIAAAAVAVAPVVIARGSGLPWHALAWVVPVAAAGLLAALGATRTLRRLPLVASLRSE